MTTYRAFRPFIMNALIDIAAKQPENIWLLSFLL